MRNVDSLNLNENGHAHCCTYCCHNNTLPCGFSCENVVSFQLLYLFNLFI